MASYAVSCSFFEDRGKTGEYGIAKSETDRITISESENPAIIAIRKKLRAAILFHSE